jgi:hypothetical protein
MTADRAALVAIAERIAEWESRVAQLRERVERLQREGSDATQARGALRVVICNLSNLYVRQSVMRRTAWAWHAMKAG